MMGQRIAAFGTDRSGSAAAEMALVLPLLLIIMMGSFELGNYFRSEHILMKGLRDGARYAARQSFTNYSTCSGDVPTPGVAGSVNENTRMLVRKGSFDSSVADRLPNWDDASTTFTVTVTCATTADGETMSGVYASMAGGAPVVTVTARVPYLPVLGAFGFTDGGITLTGTEQAAVVGL